MKKEEKRLSGLSVGESACVRSLTTRGYARRRLFDLGICEGADVECTGKSPFGDPLLFLVRGKMIAIRVDDARQIAITGEKN